MKSFLGLLLFFSGLQINAASAAPDSFGPPNLPGNLQCLDRQRQSMAYNNNQVVQWTKSTPDQFQERGLVQGKITQLYAGNSSHIHFAMSVGTGSIELIYNKDFGALPSLSVGMDVIACGDYITVGPNARLPSPKPAILHWLHYNPGNRDGGRHPHGFLVINGKPYGTAPGR